MLLRSGVPGAEGGRYLDVNEGEVRARWDDPGAWQQLVIRAVGTSAEQGGGAGGGGGGGAVNTGGGAGGGEGGEGGGGGGGGGEGVGGGGGGGLLRYGDRPYPYPYH